METGELSYSLYLVKIKLPKKQINAFYILSAIIIPSEFLYLENVLRIILLSIPETCVCVCFFFNIYNLNQNFEQN